MRQYKGTYNIESNENASDNSDVGGRVRRGQCWWVGGNWLQCHTVSHQCHVSRWVTRGQWRMAIVNMQQYGLTLLRYTAIFKQHTSRVVVKCYSLCATDYIIFAIACKCCTGLVPWQCKSSPPRCPQSPLSRAPAMQENVSTWQWKTATLATVQSDHLGCKKHVNEK